MEATNVCVVRLKKTKNREEQLMSSPQSSTPMPAPEKRSGMAAIPSYDATPPKGNKGITAPEYRAFQKAYDFFNAQLFDGTLPHVLVTLQRHARTLGYFSPDRFSGRTAPEQGARGGPQP